MKWIISISIVCVFLITGLIAVRKNKLLPSDNYGNYYEIFVYSFCDSNGDGIGDLNGITKKLDYLQKLGINGIWLTPIMPSEDYHKYSVIDYKAIDPQFGTMADFEKLVEEANKRNIRVILDLVLNHSSDQHPWFVAAKESLSKDKSSPYIAYYKIGKGDKLQDENKYALGIDDYYYESAFSEHMPDLNMSSEALQEEVRGIAQFWIDKGVSGFRLDAAKYLFEDEKQTIAFWKTFGKYCRSLNPNFYLVGEVWSPGGEIESYYQSGVDSFFNFPFSGTNGSLVTAVRQRRGEDFVQGVAKWQKRIHEASPTAIDAIFLSNHDQDRSGGMLGKQLENQKMAASLYLMLPGNPFVYYGEEIGMLGDSKDPDRRAPMIWSSQNKIDSPNPPPGTDKVMPQGKGVKEQLADPTSLLKFYQKALKLRLENPELARGTLTPIVLGDKNIGAYTTTYNGSTVIVMHNLGTETKTIVFPKSQYGYGKICGTLVAGEGKVVVVQDEITLPPQSTILLK